MIVVLVLARTGGGRGGRAGRVPRWEGRSPTGLRRASSAVRLVRRCPPFGLVTSAAKWPHPAFVWPRPRKWRTS